MIEFSEEEHAAALRSSEGIDRIWDMPQTEEFSQPGSIDVLQFGFGIPAGTALISETFAQVSVGDYPSTFEVMSAGKVGSGNPFNASMVSFDVTTTEGDDLIQGGPGADWLMGGAGDDILLGGDGADVLYSYDGDDYLDGGNGNDRLASFGGNDVIRGGGGDDWIDASRDCFVDGGGGYDVLAIEFGKSETPIVFDAASGTTPTGLTFLNIEGISAHVAGDQDNQLLVPMRTRRSFRRPLAMTCLSVAAETIRLLIRAFWRVVETIASSAVRETTGFRMVVGAVRMS
nr:hypothetical protein [Brucella tritici]